ncbi:MAG: acyl carrier protein [Paludibacteraceae bacterium]|nr:acyl carrier protein [Paludibacteraceae bacterium]
MNLQEFVVNFANQFDDTELEVFAPETSFRELEEWSSLTGLAVLNMIAKKYEVKITPAELKSVETIEALYNLVASKK